MRMLQKHYFLMWHSETQYKRITQRFLVASLTAFLLLNIVWALSIGHGFDFSSLYASGQAVRMGLNPYDIYPPLTHYTEEGRFSGGGWNPNLNSPLSLPLLSLLTQVDITTAFYGFFLAGLCLYILILRRLMKSSPVPITPVRLLWAANITGLWFTLGLGQIYIPLLLLATTALLLLEQKRYRAAGIVLGTLAALKPNFAIWIGIMLSAGYWSAASFAILTGAVLSLIPVLLYSPNIYAMWLEAIVKYPKVTYIGNISLQSLGTKLHSPTLGYALTALVFLWLIGRLIRSRPSILQASRIGLTASVLLSPVAWTSYTVFLVPVLFSQSWSAASGIAAAIFLFPTMLVFYWADRSQLHALFVGTIYTIGLLVLLAELAGLEVRSVQRVRDVLAKSARRFARSGSPRPETMLRAKTAHQATIYGLQEGIKGEQETGHNNKE